MRQFQLKVAGAMLSFDTDGNVFDSAANRVGDWTTEDNKIKLRRAGGGSELVDVAWAFNAANQFTIAQAGKVVMTLVNSTDGLPTYSIEKNQLVVDPDGDRDFSFRLACLFGMNADGNLVLSINGKESVLDGFLEDSKSRFRFQFDDREHETFPSSLVLAGRWERVAEATTELRLRFVLDDPALEIASKPLRLPAAVRVDPTRNHLALVYQSKSKGERRLQFQGSFEIRPDMTLSFRIDDVKDGGVRKSRIEVQTTFAFDTVRGNLQFFVGKERLPNAQALEIGGALRAELRGGVLDWTLAYRKTTAAGEPAKVTLATGLSFVNENGAIVIKYTQNGQSRKVDVTGRLTQADFAVSGGISIAQDPQGRSLRAFIGVSF